MLVRHAPKKDSISSANARVPAVEANELVRNLRSNFTVEVVDVEKSDAPFRQVFDPVIQMQMMMAMFNIQTWRFYMRWLI